MHCPWRYACACRVRASPPKEQQSQPVSERRRQQSPLERAKIHTELGVGYYETRPARRRAGGVERIHLRGQDLRAGLERPGLVHMDLREDAQAESDFKQALKLDPASSETKNNYGLFLCQRNRDKEGMRYLLDARQEPALHDARRGLQERRVVLANRRRQEGRGGVSSSRRSSSTRTSRRRSTTWLRSSYGRDHVAVAKQYIDRYVKAVPSVGPEALLLGARIERRMGDRTAMLANYGIQLRLRYPFGAGDQSFSRRTLRMSDPGA